MGVERDIVTGDLTHVYADAGKRNRAHADHVVAPQEVSRFHRYPRIFLAGGITGCPDWQAVATRALDQADCTVMNPLQPNFPIDDPSAAEKQIKWEWRHLHAADAIIFWFPCETLCPIALFELGKWLVQPRTKLFIGTHPDYQRRQDVEIQVPLERPYQRIHSSIEEVCEETLEWLAVL